MRRPASVLSSLAWVLAGIFTLAHIPQSAWAIVCGIPLAASMCVVGVTATAWHYTNSARARALDYGAVMICMWTLLGSAAAQLFPPLFFLCVFAGIFVASLGRSAPREVIVFAVAVFSAAAVPEFFWCLVLFAVLGGARAVSTVCTHDVIADYLHAAWHVGTAALIVYVSLQNLYAI